MSNLFTVFVLVALASTIQGGTVSPFDDIVNAANSGQWDKFQKLVYDRFGSDGWKFKKYFVDFEEVRPGNIRDLKPSKGGHVYGESEYTFHSATNNNGRRTESSGGHKIINNDGKVQEYDFKPANSPKPPNIDFKDLLKDVEFKDLLRDFKPDFKLDDLKFTIFKPQDLKHVDLSPQPTFESHSQSTRKPKTERSYFNL